MRIRNSVINMISSASGQIVTIILSFITRTIFIRYLSVEYLGLNGLFSNILTLFSLANLGIGSAITYSLYKPIAENDANKVTYLARLLEKAYFIIGVVILALGILIIPFLDIFIKSDNNIYNLTIIYIIFLINYVAPYFYGYSYRAVATAHQSEYLYYTTNTIFVIITDIIRIISLIITQNYLIFISVQTVTNIIMFMIVKKRLFRKYPYLNSKRIETQISKEEKQGIIKNIKGSVLYNFGYVVTKGTDNILMSSFIGIKYLGYLTNYQYIINAVQSILTQVFTSLVASVGNLNATETNEKKVFIFNILLFSSFWFYAFCAICILSLSDPFIELWLGKDFIVDRFVVGLLVLNFYIHGMQRAANIFRSAMGLFWYGRYRPLISATINLIMSLILLQMFGAAGIFLGTLISILTVDIWYDPYIVFRYGIKASLRTYFHQYLKYFIITITTACITYWCVSLVTIVGMSGFLIKIVICLIIPNTIFIITCHNTEEFKYLKGLVLRLINLKK